MRPLKRLTGQAKRRHNNASKARASRPRSKRGLPGGLAASNIAAPLTWPITIWYGEDLTQSC